MRYIYGPVHSRRLGLSLGVSLSQEKICDFDCIYCQLGATAQKRSERAEYAPAQDILAELSGWLAGNPQQAAQLAYITLSGLGEPTLHSRIGGLIASIKKMTPVPVAVLTNASLLSDGAVRQELMAADLVVPSLNAVTDEAFARINRPVASVSLAGIIEGLVELSKGLKGKLWLEVMIVKGVNDDLAHARKLAEIIERIHPDKIQLNSPVRCTAEEDVLAAGKDRLEKIREILGDKAEII